MAVISSNPVAKTLRKISKHIWGKRTLGHLESIRRFELESSLLCFPEGGKVLEIGSGTGWQAKALQENGFDVDAIDLDTSRYKENRIYPVVDYDGHNIPFSDDTFDVVFSSNVMEHIPHLSEFQAEIHRVLKSDGVAIHVVPSSSWRIWSNNTCFLKSWKIPEIHGEHANDLLTETMVFRKIWWQRLFERTGWQIVDIRPSHIFYTGCSMLDKRLSPRIRQTISRVLGSSTNLFILKKNSVVDRRCR